MVEHAQRTTYVLVDGKNIDATLGTSILSRRPQPGERPRWDRLLKFECSSWARSSTNASAKCCACRVHHCSGVPPQSVARRAAARLYEARTKVYVRNAVDLGQDDRPCVRIQSHTHTLTEHRGLHTCRIGRAGSPYSATHEICASEARPATIRPARAVIPYRLGAARPQPPGRGISAYPHAALPDKAIGPALLG